MAQTRTTAQRAWRALLRPRHVAASFLVFLALGGLSGTVVGFVRAADGAPAPSGAEAVNGFSLALPLSGDEGRYEVHPAAGATKADYLGRTWDLSLDFTWLDDQVVRDRDGVARWANMVRLNDTHVAGQNEVESSDELWAVEPGTSDAFALVRVLPLTEERDGVRRYGVNAMTDFTDRPDTLPCGMRNVLQGATVAVPGPDLDLGDAVCRGSPGLRDGTRRVLVPVSAVRDANGTFLRAVVWDRFGGLSGRDQPVMEYLFRSDIPYPLQVHRVGEAYVLELVAFARGSGDVHHDSEVVGGAPAPLEFAKRQPWGLDEAGVEHRFSARAAYEQALQDPTYPLLRDFLAAHPDAYLARLGYGEMDSTGGDGDWTYWGFVVTDGDVGVDVSVRRIDGGGPASLLPPGVSPLPVSKYDYSDRGVEDMRAFHYPRPEAIPAELPTASSVLRSWAAYASPAYVDKEPNSWSLGYSCSGPGNELDCGLADIRVAGGYFHYDRTYPDQALPWPPTQQPVDGYVMSSIEYRSIPGRDDLTFAHPMAYYEQRVDWRRAGQAAPVAEAPAVPASSDHVMLGFAGAWALPSSRETVAIGIGATFTSLLYFIWPALKSGGIGLFSRVRTDKLLEHPVRARLVQAVEAQPGIHQQALVRMAGASASAVDHHLRKLVDGGLLVRQAGVGFTCYFLKGRTDRRAMAAAPVLKSEVARAILLAAQTRPGVPAGVLAKELGVSAPTISYHLRRLEQAGLVESAGGIRATQDGVAAT